MGGALPSLVKFGEHVQPLPVLPLRVLFRIVL
jgi:hypothetical protein